MSERQKSNRLLLRRPLADFLVELDSAWVPRHADFFVHAFRIEIPKHWLPWDEPPKDISIEIMDRQMSLLDAAECNETGGQLDGSVNES